MCFEMAHQHCKLCCHNHGLLIIISINIRACCVTTGKAVDTAGWSFKTQHSFLDMLSEGIVHIRLTESQARMLAHGRHHSWCKEVAPHWCEHKIRRVKLIWCRWTNIRKGNPLMHYGQLHFAEGCTTVHDSSQKIIVQLSRWLHRFR